jgi:tetraacyldisaccharide 4'-kinase
VGNISAGGTGKTPLVLAIVGDAAGSRAQPRVVARGLRGACRRASTIRAAWCASIPMSPTPEHFGDEPVLIARRARVPVYISPDRAAAARELLAARIPRCDVLVSDDGPAALRARSATSRSPVVDGRARLRQPPAAARGDRCASRDRG